MAKAVKRSVSTVSKPLHKRSGTARFRSMVAAPNFVDIIDRYKQAVVNIEVEQPVRSRSSMLLPPWEMFGETNSPRAVNIGTGFLFDHRGYVLTNEHVIHGADQVRVRLLDHKRFVSARVVGTDYEMDLAVLQVPNTRNVPVLKLGRSDDIRVGEWVLAIGNPLGLDHSVTVGIVSAKERPITIGDRHYPRLVQTDAAINRGNSGGPLINLRGEVIGVNTAVSQSSHGIGFAISIDVVHNVLRRLLGSRYTP